MKSVITRKAADGKIYHSISGVNVECSGKDCNLCKIEKELAFSVWQSSIPFPIPPKGKRYINKLKQMNRGKSITEICHTCKEIPCWICNRTKCPKWMKEEHRKGQEEGCASWEKGGRCKDFVCEKGIILSHWGE